MKKKALLLGNGINNVGSNPYKWGDLVRDLIVFAAKESGVADVHKIAVHDAKPFTLLYEEVIARACGTRELSEKSVKAFIAKKADCLKTNSVYSAIAKMKVAHILTTNYEALLANALAAHSVSNAGLVRESRYNVFRRYALGERTLWPVHGDTFQPSTIVLGYEQYVGQIQRMRNYLVTGTDYPTHKLAPLALRLTQNLNEPVYSWIDLFLTHNLHIVGLTMDFVEIDLWWLLTYRSRLASKGLVSKSQNYFRPFNEIVYYIPKRYVARSQQKLEVLRSFGVRVMEIDHDGDSAAYYENVLLRVEKA